MSDFFLAKPGQGCPVKTSSSRSKLEKREWVYVQRTGVGEMDLVLAQCALDEPGHEQVISSGRRWNKGGQGMLLGLQSRNCQFWWVVNIFFFRVISFVFSLTDCLAHDGIYEGRTYK